MHAFTDGRLYDLVAKYSPKLICAGIDAMAAIDRAELANKINSLPAPTRALGRLLVERFTCRKFKQDEVRQETILQILQIAQMSASWNNTQPWKAIITMGNLTNDFADKLFLYATQNRNQVDSDFPFPAQ
jgi:hypothetical protein